ncbi:MAG: iron-sulfur cluster assembly scaffold protein [Candidatus Nezhaarchaeota archaeon]|nr:iron-sulfur cluster assembly scaffold protein [Candidatus Nezhaarchaeota archaeon]MCX8141362.1 iron-sulfur cluster assembly scaffold protein [Candidatus Nezhaarchaeota archaeon]MDW8049628.1 iron-sulfur cluster assembly scaffold protein [Nitrososphaerota archaeon]
MPLTYGKKVLELFRNPKNLGKMEDANAEAIAGSLACGDMIAIYLKVDDSNERIIDAKFESYGCAANIAAASMLTEMVKGKSLQDAWKFSWREISDALGGLPSVKYHCGILAVGALRRAIRAYYKDKPKPSWLPEELTREEKQALEEEKLMEVLSKRAQKLSSQE